MEDKCNRCPEEYATGFEEGFKKGAKEERERKASNFIDYSIRQREYEDKITSLEHNEEIIKRTLSEQDKKIELLERELAATIKARHEDQDRENEKITSLEAKLESMANIVKDRQGSIDKPIAEIVKHFYPDGRCPKETWELVYRAFEGGICYEADLEFKNEKRIKELEAQLKSEYKRGQDDAVHKISQHEIELKQQLKDKEKEIGTLRQYNKTAFENGRTTQLNTDHNLCVARDKENQKLRDDLDKAECLIHLARANLPLESQVRKNIKAYFDTKKALENRGSADCIGEAEQPIPATSSEATSDGLAHPPRSKKQALSNKLPVAKTGQISNSECESKEGK